MDRKAEVEVIGEMADARRFYEFMRRNRFRRQEYRQLAAAAVALGVPTGGRVLDVGTGPGFVAVEVARLLRGTGVQVVGMDLSQAMLTLAAEYAAEEGLAAELTWRQGDAVAMPFADGEFDLVVCSDSLHHWSAPVAVFDEIARVLKPGGACVIQDSRRLQKRAARFLAWLIGLTIPADFRVHYRGSIRSSYTPEELRALLAGSRLQGWRIAADFMDMRVIVGGVS